MGDAIELLPDRRVELGVPVAVHVTPHAAAAIEIGVAVNVIERAAFRPFNDQRLILRHLREGMPDVLTVEAAKSVLFALIHLGCPLPSYFNALSDFNCELFCGAALHNRELQQAPRAHQCNHIAGLAVGIAARYSCDELVSALNRDSTKLVVLWQIASLDIRNQVSKRIGIDNFAN
jgi:hypothetical protein